MLIIAGRMQDSIAFMISDVSRLMRRRFDERARTIGVTRTQWRVLKCLQRGEGINQGALAETLEVEPITACRMIDRLAEAELVERRRDPTDRRAWQIYLTERARPLLDDLGHLADEMLASALAGISDQEQDRVVATLQQIRNNLGDPQAAQDVAIA